MNILQGANSASQIRTKKTWRRVALLPILFLLSLAARAQEPVTNVANTSELARENLSRVAASTTQISEVLGKEPGLLIELKRWVAKEATEQGQFVEDTDLGDAAIFERLKRDAAFRSVATRLVQRYGYLTPKINPESEYAREQDLQLKERAMRLDRARAREDAAEQPSEKELERIKGCEGAQSAECEEQARRLRDRKDRTAGRGVLPPETDFPELQNRMIPPGLPYNQLTQTSLPIGMGTAEITSGSRLGQRIPDNISPGSLSLPLEDPRLAKAPSPGPSGAKGMPLRGLEKEREEGLESPETTRRANPYADIPSLYDMYVQASDRRVKLERFGLEVFLNRSSDSDVIPMDLPAGPDYVVGPGDGLAIDLWGSVSQRFVRTVDREGRLSLPEAGPVLVSGRTLGQVQQTVQQILRTQFRDVSADVSLGRLRTVRVYVVGDVLKPGAYDISSLSTPLNALVAAGGITARGSLRALRHFRGKQLVQEVDAYDLLLHGVRSDLKRLENGDTLMVPPLGPQVGVEGMVRRPAIYELHDEKTLAETLELAGGILPTATLHHIEVRRIEAHQKRTMLDLDIAETSQPEEIKKQLESFAIQDGDEIHIFPIAPFNQNTVYLQGHVLRPGRYSYHPGMRLTELVSSYADLLPEPATKYAEIIRLNAPDYRPSVESFDLAAALTNSAAAPKIQPLDTVRIFSRYNFEELPIVWVSGEVRSPGNYRSTGQVHFREAIQQAGGVTPDALLDTAQLFRTLPDGRLKIMSVNLRQALSGDPLENILLQPRDRILVHKNLAKVDPPSVTVKGEVAKPGRFPLTTNLRVGDLIQLAGGLKRSAYAESADLTRYWAQDSRQETGEHHKVNIAAALSGNADQDLPLRDGDVLTIPMLPGWTDIGASITLRGEVEHPGVYGIQPGERLSSVLKRAGGFRTTAYPRAAVLERIEVQQLQEKNKQDLIQRLEGETTRVKIGATESAAEAAALQQAATLQRQRMLEGLRKAPVSGRLVVHLRSDLPKFENSVDDIEVRAGDTLQIPKRPGFVAVVGQVYNSNAVTFQPNKTAGWYLQRAGGPTDLADRKAVFVVRANGSVVSRKGSGLWSGNTLSTRIEPGDTVIVPERALGGPSTLKTLVSVAQVMQSAALTAAVIGKF